MSSYRGQRPKRPRPRLNSDHRYAAALERLTFQGNRDRYRSSENGDQYFDLALYLLPLLYTTFVFQLPRLKTTALAIARSENAIVIAQKTPLGPIPK